MSNKAFYKIHYGVFLLTARAGNRDNGCIINTAIQCASAPLQMSICVINQNLTCDMIRETGRFNISILPQSTPFELFRHFGQQSGRTVDKCAGRDDMERLPNGILSLTTANAVFSCTVTEAHDLGSHTLFVATVDDAKVLSDDPSMTYAFYQSDVKPKPVAAGSKRRYICRVCGYVYAGAQLPDDFICPLCHHGADDFDKIEASTKTNNNIENSKGENTMKKFVCRICGYVYEGETAPEICPQCKQKNAFDEMQGDMKLAAEHEYGVYAKTVKNNENVSDADKKYILEQLMANFNGECSEVGMYLCMTRIAHREGYPEVGLYWEKAAYEEAEHAAKFAELLGSELEPNMTDSTKKNLAWRVDCEFGATQGKFDLAKCAKANGLDAIHDTVHEMARDEARHGKALKGLLERYFK